MITAHLSNVPRDVNHKILRCSNTLYRLSYNIVTERWSISLNNSSIAFYGFLCPLTGRSVTGHIAIAFGMADYVCYRKLRQTAKIIYDLYRVWNTWYAAKQCRSNVKCENTLIFLLRFYFILGPFGRSFLEPLICNTPVNSQLIKTCCGGHELWARPFTLRTQENKKTSITKIENRCHSNLYYHFNYLRKTGTLSNVYTGQFGSLSAECTNFTCRNSN